MTANPRKLMSRVRGKKNAEDVLHSSGFAQVQSQHYGSEGYGGVPGSYPGGASGSYEATRGQGGAQGAFASQRAADERRRFTRGYENARIMRGAYTAERARAYVPRTQSGFGSGLVRGGRDTSGDGISGSLIGRKLPPALAG